MKKILILAILIGASITPTFSQSEETEVLKTVGILHIDSVYQDKTTYLLFSKVIQMDSLSQSEIRERVKNWAGRSFVNMEEVLVSETESQLVFNYIENYSTKLASMQEYTRMIVQIKDNRLKVSFYDDGNVFISGSGSAPSVPSRTQFIKDYFRKDTIIENKGLMGKLMFQSVDSYQRGVNSTIKSFESGIKEVIAKKEDSDF